MDQTLFQQAWLWVGNEFIAFGVRWIVVGMVMLGFGGWIGLRYRELKREVAELKDARNSPPVQIYVGDIPRDRIKQSSYRHDSNVVRGNVAKHIPDDKIVRIGTKAGPMEIRLWDENKTVKDLMTVLHKNGVLESLDE